jgi:ribokinase
MADDPARQEAQGLDPGQELTNPRPPIAVVGGASLDILHFRGRTEPSIGGAGLYTALAAQRAGAQVTMFAPRPDPMPPQLIPVAERINWVGPSISADDLPSFEIAHYGDGRAELVNARWGAEALLTPENLPDEGLPGSVMYCGPLADPARQLAFVRRFKGPGITTGVGTYWRAVATYPDIVRQMFAEADLFFCNEREARGLFGSLDAARTQPGKLLFVTLSADGALVIQGETQTHVGGVTVEELDPTGAGDTFCGTTCALLAQGWHPVEAARRAVAAAAEMITAVGPTLLFSAMPPAPSDPRVKINRSQVERVAALIAALPDFEPYPFVGDDFPPPGHPMALDFFFASTLQQFGFWREDDGRYQTPMIAPISGQDRKGSDYLWAVFRRWLDEDPAGLTPQRQAALTADELAERFRSDRGDNPLPAFELAVQMARGYGHDMTTLGWTPADILARANANQTPLRAFLMQLDHIGGYKEDPLRKKAALLAIILQQRPERFLRSDPAEPAPPIIDYHLQRSCLRIGLVDVLDAALRDRLVARRLLAPADEWAVRSACYVAIELVQSGSGHNMGAVDWFFFGARRRCPEMTEPDCPHCPVDPVCAHLKDLFQPVIRTSFY